MTRISEIKIVPVKSDNGLVGFASFIFDDAFFMCSIGIFKRVGGGYRLTYPLRKNTLENINYFNPINKQVAEEIEEQIIKKLMEEEQ